MKSIIEVDIGTNRVLRMRNGKQRSESFVIMKI